MRYLTPGDIVRMSVDKTVKIGDITVPEGYFVAVNCDEVQCGCGKCPPYAGTCMVRCESENERDTMVIALKGYVEMVQVRPDQKAIDRMLRLVADQGLDGEVGCPKSEDKDNRR